MADPGFCEGGAGNLNSPPGLKKSLSGGGGGGGTPTHFPPGIFWADIYIIG